MNLIAIQNKIRELSDGQIVHMMQNPSPAAPSYLLLSELQNRKEMRSGVAQPAPQGTMAEQYTQGLGANGPQNLAGVMGQSQMTGQPVPYAGGQMQAQGPQMQNPRMEQGAPQGFADGGEVRGSDAPMYMSPYERQMRRLAETPLNTPGDIRDPRLMSTPGMGWRPPDPDYSTYQDPGGSGVPNAPAVSLRLPSFEGLGFDTPGAMTLPKNIPPLFTDWQRPKPTGLWGSDAPPGTGVNLTDPQEEYGPPAELGPNGGAAPDDRGGPRMRPPSGGGGGGGGAGGAGGVRSPQGLADFIGEVRAQMGPDRYAALSKDNAEAKAQLKAAKETDKGLALLQAGLGILGGTSPNAGVNIGRGASIGLQAYNESNKENRVAEQGLRAADQQIAIAQANRDERMLETALKSKMHWEEQIQRSLDRQASAGAAAGSRADAAAARRDALEDRKLDRAETRQLREHDGAVKSLAEAARELHDTDAAMTAISKDMGIMPADKEGMLAPLRARNKDAADTLKAARARLNTIQGERDNTKGRAIPAPAGPAGVYVPGKGIQWAN